MKPMITKQMTSIADSGGRACGSWHALRKEPVKERMAMEKKGVAIIAFACLLGVAGALPAHAQFNSGSSGTHGVFPPTKDAQGADVTIPNDAYNLIWNIRTGTVRYCNSYAFNTGLDQCNPGASTAVAQIPNIPQGGLTSGVYEFTNFSLPTISNIRQLVIVGYTPNTPLSILSQQDIDFPGGGLGSYNVWLQGQTGKTVGGSSVGFAAAGGTGGPGGFDGGSSGNGSSTPSSGAAGYGPVGGAGGNANGSNAVDFYGVGSGASPLNPSLTPLAGGSGGGGGAGIASGVTIGTQACGTNVIGYGGGPGGGGGGALLLAASNMVRLGSGLQVFVRGGDGGYNDSTPCRLFGGGGGGGSVRIVAQQVTGTATIFVGGGYRADGSGQVRAPGGFVRIETASNQYTGTIDGASGGSFVSFPTAPLPTNTPSLKIVSVAGTTAPTNPGASLGSPDITFGNAIETPVTVVVQANNVPLTATVNLRVVPAAGSPTSATANALSGSASSSTAQATVTLPPGAGIITASATFNVSGGGGGGGGLAFSNLPLIDGERPTQVEVVAGADGMSRTYLIAKSGARFELGQALR